MHWIHSTDRQTDERLYEGSSYVGVQTLKMPIQILNSHVPHLPSQYNHTSPHSIPLPTEKQLGGGQNSGTGMGTPFVQELPPDKENTSSRQNLKTNH